MHTRPTATYPGPQPTAMPVTSAGCLDYTGMTFASRLSLDQPVRQEKVRVRKANVANWVGLLAATAIFIAVGAGVLWGVQRFIADARHVAHTHEVIASVDAFEARLRDAE